MKGALIGTLALATGIWMAVAMNGRESAQQASRQDTADTFYAEHFKAVPASSAGATYLALLGDTER